MKRILIKFLAYFILVLFKTMSWLPVIGGFGKQMYASCLFGDASGLYFAKRYEKAIKAYERVLGYAQGMEDISPFQVSFSQAYEAMGTMHKNGLGTDKDEAKAEYYYLLAGSRGDTAYEHKVATKSWYESHWK